MIKILTKLELVLLRLVRIVTTLSIFLFVILAYVSAGEAQEQNMLDEILKNAERIGFDEKQDMVAIYDLDAYFYFSDKKDFNGIKESLTYIYNTPLKRKVFEETPECIKMMNELKVLKSHLFDKTYYVVSSYNLDRKRLLEIYLRDYDIKRKGFPTDFGKFRCGDSKEVNDFYFKPVPAGLFLPVKEEQGLYIESHHEDTEIYFIFKITGRSKVSVSYYDDEKGCYKGKKDAFLVGPVRVIFANKTTGEIYYNNLFK